MKGKITRILILLVAVFSLCNVTKATGRDTIKLNVPFAFLADGEAMPAGTYTLSRFTDDKSEGLILRNESTRTSVIVHTTEVNDASFDKPQLSFARVGGVYVLSKIRTSHDVYTVPADRDAILEATARSHQSQAVPTSSAGK